ncbi:MAG TPA: hypothetical protein VM324_17005 [Egibacteraceae bacterium]|nr:hypothetical protein [Egibacteraceae bacterium]
MTDPGECPQCGRVAEPDGRRPAQIAELPFRSFTCDRPPSGLTDHPFPVRWLESVVPGQDEVQAFNERFVRVRGPLPEGSAIAEAFGDVDPIHAWIERQPTADGIRVLIRL